jgi:hypothetical protein
LKVKSYRVRGLTVYQVIRFQVQKSGRQSKPDKISTTLRRPLPNLQPVNFNPPFLTWSFTREA